MGADTSPPPYPGVSGPLGVIETVQTSLGLYRADLATLWQAMALVIVPLELLIFVLRVISVPRGAVLANSTIYVPAGASNALAASETLGELLTVLVLLVSIGAAYRILLGRRLYHPADLVTSFGFALERLAPLIWVSVCVFAVVLVGLLLLIIPGIYLAVCLSIAVPVLMAEDHRGMSALARSRELVSGHWWHVLGCSILAGVVAVGGEVLIGLLVGPIVSALSAHSITGYLLIQALLSALVAILFSPFTAAVSVVLYVDMLVRRRDPQLGRLLA